MGIDLIMSGESTSKGLSAFYFLLNLSAMGSSRNAYHQATDAPGARALGYERARRSPPIVNLLGRSLVERREWLRTCSFEEFMAFIYALNSKLNVRKTLAKWPPDESHKRYSVFDAADGLSLIRETPDHSPVLAQHYFQALNQGDSGLDLDEKIIMLAYLIVLLHPFPNGNGRTVRFFMDLFLFDGDPSPERILKSDEGLTGRIGFLQFEATTFLAMKEGLIGGRNESQRLREEYEFHEGGKRVKGEMGIVKYLAARSAMMARGDGQVPKIIDITRLPATSGSPHYQKREQKAFRRTFDVAYAQLRTSLFVFMMALLMKPGSIRERCVGSYLAYLGA